MVFGLSHPSRIVYPRSLSSYTPGTGCVYLSLYIIVISPASRFSQRYSLTSNPPRRQTDLKKTSNKCVAKACTQAMKERNSE